MVNRKKRLKKGIESLKNQIEIHKEKLRQAEQEGRFELISYYEKELLNLEKAEKEKEKLLEKAK